MSTSHSAGAPQGSGRVPRLLLVTDRHATAGRELVDVVRAALDGGLPAVQLRDKDLCGRDLWRLAERLRTVTAAARALLFVNDRVDVACAVGADGVHLGERAMAVDAARALLAPGRLVGVSTHAAGAAHAAGADFVCFGPVNATPSKAAFGPPQGMARLHAACAAATVPVLAIGGIAPDHVAAACAAGAHGVAVIRAVLAAPDPAVAVQAFLATLAAHGAGG